MGRRVLADIDWWIVTDGQRDSDHEESEHDHEHNHDEQGNILAVEAHSDGVAGASPHFFIDSTESSPLLPTHQLAALSIAPQTPPRRRHTLEGSSSSLESNPEDADGPVESMRLGMQYLHLGVSDGSPNLPNETLPQILDVPSCSFAEYLEKTATHIADFAVSPLSSYSTQIFN